MYVKAYLKTFADLLTSLRFLIGVYFPYLGIIKGKAGFLFVLFLMVLGWLSDVLDGALARASKVKYRTFIGDHDFHVDFVFSFGLLLYLVISGFLSFIIIFVYLICAFLERRSFAERELNSFLAIPYAFSLYNAFKYHFFYAVLISIFLILILIFTWDRFINDKFPNFIAEVKSIWKK